MKAYLFLPILMLLGACMQTNISDQSEDDLYLDEEDVEEETVTENHPNYMTDQVAESNQYMPATAGSVQTAPANQITTAAELNVLPVEQMQQARFSQNGNGITIEIPAQQLYIPNIPTTGYIPMQVPSQPTVESASKPTTRSGNYSTPMPGSMAPASVATRTSVSQSSASRSTTPVAQQQPLPTGTYPADPAYIVVPATTVTLPFATEQNIVTYEQVIGQPQPVQTAPVMMQQPTVTYPANTWRNQDSIPRW